MHYFILDTSEIGLINDLTGLFIFK